MTKATDDVRAETGADEPAVHIFKITDPEDGKDIRTEGNTQFCHAHEVTAFMRWARAEIAALRADQKPQAGGAVEGLNLANLHAANIARQAEWCPDQLPDLSFRGNELGGEVGEAQNCIKKLERERLGWRGSRSTVEALAEELADVVICADLCAVTAGIDLGRAVVAKFNATSEKNGLSVMLDAAPSAAPKHQAGGAVEEIAAERRRQVEVEEWTPEHDDVVEDQGQLAGAAACYAFGLRLWTGEENGQGYLRNAATIWPWHDRFWKPAGERRNLVRAGALIVAAIERLDRLAAPSPAPKGEV